MGCIHPHGEGAQGVERGHAFESRLLCAAREHDVLHPAAYHHHGRTDGVTAAGAGGAHGEAGAAQTEDAAEVHAHGGGHQLKHQSVAQHRRVVLLVHDVRGLYHAAGRRVVAEDAARLVRLEVVLVESGAFERLSGGHVGVLRLLRESGACVAVEHCLGDLGGGDEACECAAVSVVQPLGFEPDAALSGVQCTGHAVETLSDARPDAHSRDDDSSCHIFL